METSKEKIDNKLINLWLLDLRTQTEPECLHSLQTKSIVPAELADDDYEQVERLRNCSPNFSLTPTNQSTLSTSSQEMSSSSSSTSSHQPLSSFSSGTLYSMSGRKLSSGGLTWRRQEQRRSQQKFLNSMTDAIHAVSTPLMNIRNVEMTANVISGEFSKICKHVEFGILTQVPTLILSLVGHIEDFLRHVHSPPKRSLEGDEIAFSNHLNKLEMRLQQACYSLEMSAQSMSEAATLLNASDSSRRSSSINPPPFSSRSTSTSPNSSTSSNPPCSFQDGVILSLSLSSTSPHSEADSSSLDRQYQHFVGEVVNGIVAVGNLFSQLVDLRLTRDLTSILDTIESGGIPARIALKSLVTVLADGGNHICRLAAVIRTVRVLLELLMEVREDQDKILALRCLATVLCVGEAVKDFDRAGGFEIIAEFLYDPGYPVWIKIESVAVLTQATDPWIDMQSSWVTLGVYLEKLIISLTNLLKEFKTEEEPFLLIVAAVSNLTFLEGTSTNVLKRCRTVSHLIGAVKGNPGFSVFILDNIATVLANMAGIESCRQEIIHCGGLDALLHFLQQRPSLPGKTDSASAITACERLQQKATIAISRLANEEGVANYIFNAGGVHRLITLCRKEKERNYSDGVLIAALVTLRKLISICGDDMRKRLNGADDLIEPRLLDSFLLYSSRQESYV